MLQQNPRREVGASAGTANGQDLPVTRELAEACAQLGERDVDRARHAFDDQLHRLAHVEQERRFGVIPVGERHVIVQNIRGDHPGEVDRVLGAAELRRVAELRFLEVVDGRTHLDRHCQRAYALVHRRSVLAERLGAKEAFTEGRDEMQWVQWLYDILRKRATGIEGFVLEDESRLIGCCSLPLEMHQGMQHFPLVWLEDSLESRVQRILRDYVIDLCAEFVALYGAREGFDQYAGRLRESLANIHKRLGGERYQRLQALLETALHEQSASGETAGHQAWIEALLREYYDPMYAFQRESKAGRIEFSGTQDEVIAYLLQRRAARV